jgi:hypothetical protein
MRRACFSLHRYISNGYVFPGNGCIDEQLDYITYTYLDGEGGVMNIADLRNIKEVRVGCPCCALERARR